MRRLALILLTLASTLLRAQTPDSTVAISLPDGLTLQLAWVEGGTFIMGGGDRRDVSHNYEASFPAHQVSLNGYYIGIYEVTQAQWTAVMGANPSRFTAGGDSLPVEQVSWVEAQQFVVLLSQLTGHRFRLPTEAEWEYAARGGQRSHGTSYAGCQRNQLPDHAWFCVNSGGSTHPVGSRLPNELGLYDMSGNVAEWCSDWMESYTDAALDNPRGPARGDSRILRGGHYYGTSPTCTVFDRSWYVPSGRSEFYGLRVVMEPDTIDEEE